MSSNQKAVQSFITFRDLRLLFWSFDYLFIRYSGSNIVNNVTATLSDDEMAKIKVIDLDKFCNFYVHDFFN
jgi:hypothetical protein